MRRRRHNCARISLVSVICRCIYLFYKEKLNVNLILRSICTKSSLFKLVVPFKKLPFPPFVRRPLMSSQKLQLNKIFYHCLAHFWWRRIAYRVLCSHQFNAFLQWRWLNKAEDGWKKLKKIKDRKLLAKKFVKLLVSSLILSTFLKKPSISPRFFLCLKSPTFIYFVGSESKFKIFKIFFFHKL